MLGVLGDLAALDGAALAWFLLAWLGYSPLMRALRTAGSINARMDRMRRGWMHAMLGRDNRITDASLIGHTVNSAAFFASTTILALAALLGLLGNIEQTYASVGRIAFTAKAPRALLEAQLLLLVLVFAHSFLKLTWALRQLNYCVAFIGAAPLKPDAAQRGRIADRYGVILSLAISSFNAGIRGYYFALAALAWLLGMDGVAAIPKAASPERQRENMEAATLRLDAEDRAALAALPKDRRMVNPAIAPDWDS